ncbi:dinB [Acrasis kona]|uniref:DinB n=1 Tax=Acrasis kona TaxID=1008807 RepID=A0AAW2YVT9_9EUKA
MIKLALLIVLSATTIMCYGNDQVCEVSACPQFFLNCQRGFKFMTFFDQNGCTGCRKCCPDFDMNAFTLICRQGYASTIIGDRDGCPTVKRCCPDLSLCPPQNCNTHMSEAVNPVTRCPSCPVCSSR